MEIVVRYLLSPILLLKGIHTDITNYNNVKELRYNLIGGIIWILIV